MRFIVIIGLVFLCLSASAQVDREDTRMFSDMLKDALGEVDSTKYPVLKLYPVSVLDRSWYNPQRQGIDIKGERSASKKGLFTYDPLDTVQQTFAIKIDADLIAQGLNDAGYNIAGVTKVMSLVYYNAGDDCWVLADTLGVTFSSAGGTATLTVPDGVTVFTANIWGALADLDVNDDFTIVIDKTGVSYNTSASNIQLPEFSILNATSFVAGGPSPTMPFIYDEGNAPQRQVIGVAAGDLTLRAINMNVFSYWMINLNF